MTRLSFCKCGVDSTEVHPAQATFTESSPPEKNSFVRNLKNYVKEFCREGSLHGVKYLGQDRTIIEKIWWAISMAVSLYLCINLVLSAYNKWQNSPVIVSFATKETPIWQVPFPTVTICPETKALPRIYNFSYYLQQKKEKKVLTKEEDKKFGYISLVCNYDHDVNYTAIEDKHTNGNDVIEFLNEIQPDFYKMVSECKYMGVLEKCSDLFVPIITDEGVCYTFNLLDRSQLYRDNVVHFKNYHKAPLSNWSIQYGYHLEDETITYPRRALFAGASFALEAKFTIFDEELEYSCGSTIQGYKVQISHPSRIPRVKEQHFRVPLDTAIIAAVAPDMTVTSDAVKNYSPTKRNCYLPSERPLKYFRVYTQQNCQIECKTNYTIQKCGCTNFYMPRDNSTKICTGGKLDCIYKSDQHLLYKGIDQKLKTIRQGKKIKSKDKCDCLPICTSMYYNVENSQSNWEWRKHYPGSDGKHMSSLQVFFKGNQFITMERNELFGMTDFLANFGGLLGLFVGFSLLSLIEIIYYCTLRIICNIQMFGSQNWSGSPELT